MLIILQLNKLHLIILKTNSIGGILKNKKLIISAMTADLQKICILIAWLNVLYGQFPDNQKVQKWVFQQLINLKNFTWVHVNLYELFFIQRDDVQSHEHFWKFINGQSFFGPFLYIMLLKMNQKLLSILKICMYYVHHLNYVQHHFE